MIDLASWPLTSLESEGKSHARSRNLSNLWIRFACYGVVVALAGYSLAQLAIPLGEKTGLSHGIVGGIFTAVSTSIPELVVAIAAVRMGALNLAVGDIIGEHWFGKCSFTSPLFWRAANPLHP